MSIPMELYVAPARRSLSQVHIVGERFHTICGQDLTDTEELWTPVLMKDGDTICPACLGTDPEPALF